MRIKYFTTLILVLFFVSFLKANNPPVSIDSLQHLFIKFGQKKIKDQMARNQVFFGLGQFDSINYVINIDSKTLFAEAALDPYIVQEYIVPNTQGDKFINDKVRLDTLNNRLIVINANRTIKTYLLLVNYVELTFKDGVNAADVQNAFYNIGTKESVSAQLVDSARIKSRAIVEKISGPILNADINFYSPFLFFGLIKYSTAVNTKNAYQIITYSPITNSQVQDGYKDILALEVKKQTWRQGDKGDNQYPFIAIDAIAGANQGYDDITSVLAKIMLQTTTLDMYNLLSPVKTTSLAMLTLDQRLYALKILSAENFNSSDIGTQINNLLTSTPPSKIDSLLAALLLVNDKAIISTKQGTSLFYCILVGETDPLFFGNNAYLDFTTAICQLVKTKSTYKADEDAFFNLSTSDLSNRIFLWDKSYTTHIFTVPSDGTNNYGVEFDKSCNIAVSRQSSLSFTRYAGNTNQPYKDFNWIDMPKISGLNPYTLVGFVNRSDLSFLSEAVSNLNKGETPKITIVPAIFLKYAADKKFNDDAGRTAVIALDVAVSLAPITKVYDLSILAQRAYLALDGFYAVGALSNLAELGSNPLFKDVVDGYNNLLFIVGGTQAGTEIGLKLLKGSLKIRQTEVTTFLKQEESAYADLVNLSLNSNASATQQKMANALLKVREELLNEGKIIYGDAWYTGILSASKNGWSVTANKFKQIINPVGTVFKDLKGSTIAHIVNNDLVLDNLATLTDVNKVVGIIEDAKYFDGIGINIISEDLIIVQKADGSYACLKGACFIAGTKVHTTHGTKPIEQIAANDEVQSFDEITQTNTVQRVVRTFKKTTHKLMRIITGKDTIFATPEHPFYVKDDVVDGMKQGSWLSAGKLKTGFKVLLTSGLLATVSNVQAIDTTAIVYNFEVAKTHTYYVGERGVLVHNSCESLDALRKNHSGIAQQYWDDFANAISPAHPSDLRRISFYTALDGFDDQTLRLFIQNFNAAAVEYKTGILANSRLINAWKNVPDKVYLRNDMAFLITTSDFLEGRVSLSFSSYGCTLADEAVIRHYTSEAYSNLNLATEGVIPITNTLQEFKDALVIALSKLPTDYRIAYRGLGKYESNIAKSWVKGQTITTKKFWSSSVEKKVAVDFMHNGNGNVLVYLTHKIGKYVEDITVYKGEKEAIITINQIFKVDDIKPSPTNPNITEIYLSQQ